MRMNFFTEMFRREKMGGGGDEREREGERKR